MLIGQEDSVSFVFIDFSINLLLPSIIGLLTIEWLDLVWIPFFNFFIDTVVAATWGPMTIAFLFVYVSFQHSFFFYLIEKLYIWEKVFAFLQ